MLKFDNVKLTATFDDKAPAGLPPLYTIGGDNKDGIVKLGRREREYGLFFVNATDKDDDGKPIPSSMLTVLGVKHLAYARGLVIDKGRLSIEPATVKGRPYMLVPVGFTTIQVALEPTPAQLEMGAVPVTGNSETARILWRTNGRAIGSPKPANENGKQFSHSFIVRVFVPMEAFRALDVKAGRQIECWDLHDTNVDGYVDARHVAVKDIDKTLYKNRKQVAEPEKGTPIGTATEGDKEVKPFVSATL